MRCGICGETEYQRILNGRLTTVRLFNGHELNYHKAQDHPEEYAATAQKRKDTLARKGQAQHDARGRSKEARQAVARDVVIYSRGAYQPYSTAYNAPRSIEPRYPAPVSWLQYRRALEDVGFAQEQVAKWLKIAWEGGTPVPQEDFDAVATAGEQAAKEKGGE